MPLDTSPFPEPPVFDIRIEKLQQIINQSHRLVFFGGAGVSTESGLPDFRSPEGIYTKEFSFPPEKILTAEFFHAYPEEFFLFYRRYLLFPDAKPNPCHETLARLEKAGILRCIITQNIDGLHQKAGSKRVLELHGSIHKNTCVLCNKTYDALYMQRTVPIPYCTCGARIKPNVVLYGESLSIPLIQRALDAVSHADTLIVAGTSLSVYPAATIANAFCEGNLVIINKTPTPLDRRATLVIRKPVAETMGQIHVPSSPKQQ